MLIEIKICAENNQRVRIKYKKELIGKLLETTTEHINNDNFDVEVRENKSSVFQSE